MKKLFFTLALMLIGSLAFANSNIDTSIQSYDSTELKFNNNKTTQNISYSTDAGICTAHVTSFNSDGEVIGTFDISWESDSASSCESEIKAFSLWLNAL